MEIRTPEPITPDFNRQREAGEIISAAGTYVRVHLRSLATALLWIAGPFVLLGAALDVALSTRFVDLLAGIGDDDLGMLGEMVAMVGSQAAMGGVVSGAAALVGYGHISLVRAQQEPTLEAVLREVRRLLGPYLWLSLVMFGAVVISLLLHLLICIGTIIWFALLVLALPYLNVLFPARLFVSPSVGAAYRLSRQVVQPYFGRALGTTVLALLLLFVLSAAAGIVASIPELFVMGVDPTSAHIGPLEVIVLFLGGVVGNGVAVLTAFMSIVAAYLFFGLHEVEHGDELRRELAALRGQVQS